MKLGVIFNRRFCSIFNIKSKQKLGRSVYLDNAATTPTDPRVLDAMLPFMTSNYGNPHSRSHMYGWESEKAVENARAEIASVINCEPNEIIFTSGATESNNLAIKGLARFYGKTKKHLITTQTEHKCVLDSFRYLESEGFKVTYLPVTKSGLIDLELLEKSITDETIGVSVIFVNNETGVLENIPEIGAICKKKKVFLHTDAAQAFGKVQIDVQKMNIDLLSISGHKIYGPKGVGALFVRKRPRVRLTPILSGGGQERGLRSGTLPTHLAVGLGEASKISREEGLFDYEHVKKLNSYLLTEILKIPNVYVNAHRENCYPGILNVSFEFIEGESLIMSMKNVAISSGSACTSASLEPSYVLRALGVNEELAHTSIRFSIGRFSTQQDIEFTADLLKERVDVLREMSPLWEFHKEGVNLETIQWTGGACETKKK